MKNKQIFKHLDFFIFDFINLLLSIYLATFISHVSFSMLFTKEYKNVLIFELMSFVVLTFFNEPYKSILKQNAFKNILNNFAFSGLQLLFVTTFLFVLKISEDVSRIYIILEYVIFFIISSVFKYIWKKILLKLGNRSLKVGKKSLLIVTDTEHLKNISSLLLNHNYTFARVVGICVLDKDLKGQTFDGFHVVCNTSDLLSYACSHWIDGVFFDVHFSRIPEYILNGLSTAGIRMHLKVSDISSLEGQEQHLEKMFNETVLTSSVKERTNEQRFFKKLIDIVGGFVGSFVCILLTLIVGPIILIKSPGAPLFYKQERIGLNGRRFYIYKFRSMIPHAEEKLKELESQNRVKSGLMFKMKDDPRIIPGIGTFIRKTSIDEFPQFFNVLKGEMSLVGTRPPTVNEWEKYEVSHRIRMSTKPGITGMWQTSGRNEITNFDEVVALDAYYINNWSLFLDIKILWKTFVMIFKRSSSDETM